MGYTLTQEHKRKINSSLDIDKDGKVVFTDFVELAKEMFAFKLDSGLEARLAMALSQKESTDYPAKKVGTNISTKLQLLIICLSFH